MSPKSGLRLVSLHVLLVGSMIQGLTPGPYTIVSRWALQRLDPCAATGHPDARYGHIPENDRPAPSNGADHDGTPDEVVSPGDLRTPTILSRRSADLPGYPFRATGLTNHPSRPGLLLARPHRPADLVTDSLSSLCRMTC